MGVCELLILSIYKGFSVLYSLWFGTFVILLFTVDIIYTLKFKLSLGCFGVNGLGDSTTVKVTNITNNQPKICYRQCGNWNLFALLASISI